MKPNFDKSKSAASSEILPTDPQTEIGSSTPGSEKIDNTTDSPDSISVTVSGSKLPFSLNQLAVLGSLSIALIATFFLVTRGNDFCFLSICNEFPYKSSIVYSFWSVAGGLGAFGILGLMGFSAPVAILGALATWLLMHMSLN
jgi:hypothetical protein